MSDVAPQRVAVIGGGITGVSAALFLQSDGHTVTLFEPDAFGTGTSMGNAGVISLGSCIPTAMPGIPGRVPKMLLDPKGPLVVRWRYLHRIAPWLLDLLWASRPQRVEEISIAKAALGDKVEAAWLELARRAGAEEALLPRGWLDVYETEAVFQDSAEERRLMERRGRAREILNADELRQLEPNLAPIFVKGAFDPKSYHLVNPARMTASVAAAFAGGGGLIERQAVSALEPGPDGIGLRCDGGLENADRVVLAAGAWSGTLARPLGVRPRLDTERGYHLMLPQPERTISRPVYNVDRSFVLTPMETGLRMTTQVEFAGLEAPPDYRRIEGLLGDAQQILPGLKPEVQSRWLGFRPSHPDSLPVIGPAPRDGRVICAYGHGHLGMTQGPATGRIVADLIAGRDPGLDVGAYSAARG